MTNDHDTFVGRWMALLVLVPIILIGVGVFVAWWILSSTPPTVAIRIDAPTVPEGLDVFINGRRVGATPYVLELADAWALSDATLVPANWPPPGATMGVTRRKSSNYTIRGGMVLTDADARTEHILFVNENANGSVKTLALRIRVTTADGSAVYLPKLIQAKYATMAGHWRGEITVEFAERANSP